MAEDDIPPSVALDVARRYARARYEGGGVADADVLRDYLATNPVQRRDSDLPPMVAWPQLPPMPPKAELRNPGPRPSDAMAPVSEALAPFPAAYGMGQSAAETYLRGRAGDYAGAAESALPLGLAALPIPGAKRSVFDWSNPGGAGTAGLHARTTKVGDTTLMYGVGPESAAELISMRTPPAKRGQGSARDALTRFLSEADERNLEVKLTASPLDRRTNDQKLRAFYQSLGFRPTGRTMNVVGDPEMIRPAGAASSEQGSQPFTVFRAGDEAGRGGATFYALDRRGAEPYATGSGQPIKEYAVAPSNILDTKRPDHRALYEQFMKDTGHPGRYGRNAYPYWTAEQDFRSWLASKGHKFDAMLVDENTGHPSIAMYSPPPKE